MFKKSPALFLLIFTVVGIVIADSFRIAISYFFIALILSIVISLFLFKSEKIKLLAFCLGVGIFSFVGLRFASLYYETGVNHVSNYIDNKSTYTIYAKVSDWPELKLDRTELILDLDSLENDNINHVNGKILLTITSTTTMFQRGDNLVLNGRIYAISGESFSKEFNYNRYLRYKEISGVVFQATPLHILHDKANRYSIIPFVDKLRNSINNCFKINLSPLSSALASGFLIGETRDIPPELYKRFKDSGTLHLLAVSGSNVILVITFFIFLFRPLMLSRKKRAVMLIAVVILFSLLSYGEPSVVRASIMATLVLIAGLFERRFELKNIIAVAALMILLFVPSQLFDLGFQLSFVIAWGLILVVPKLNQLFKKHSQKKWYTFLLFPFLISLTAQLFSFGLIGLYFKQIPLISPIANLFVVPLVSIAVIGVLVLLVADLIFPLLGAFIGSILNLILEFTVSIVEVFGSENMPFVSVHDWSIVGVSGLYLILFMIPFALFSKNHRRIFIFILLLLLNIYAFKSALASIQGEFSLLVRCSNIPGGNMSIVQQNANDVDLIINGIRGKAYKIDEKIILPSLKNQNIHKIDKLIILNSDFSALDDLLRIAESYKVQNIYVPQALHFSILDQIKNLNSGFHLDSLNILKTESIDSHSEGYIYNDKGISLRYKNNNITIASSVSPVYLKALSSETNHYLIIGSKWNISLNDYLRFKELGYSKIICSKIAQTEIEEYIGLTETSTDLIVDLFKINEYTLKFK